jgi:glycerol-3-phosphate dehydrogenase (NAD(P)+)
VRLPALLSATTDPADAIADADLVVLAMPSQTLRENLVRLTPFLRDDVTLVSLMKGVELHTLERMSQVVGEVTRADPERVAVLSGPNLAREIAAEHWTASVVACEDEERATRIADACTTGYFRPYINHDVLGCELGGAVKNVIALAVGMAAGMGFGDNTMASLVTRGLAETGRLGLAMGADPLTFAGLAGMGDLVATCMSPLSRNRTFGEKLGRGLTPDEVMAGQHQVAEGVKSCRAVLGLAERYAVDMPITEHVVRVIYDGLSPRAMLSELMARDRRLERVDAAY